MEVRCLIDRPGEDVVVSQRRRVLVLAPVLLLDDEEVRFGRRDQYVLDTRCKRAVRTESVSNTTRTRAGALQLREWQIECLDRLVVALWIVERRHREVIAQSGFRRQRRLGEPDVISPDCRLEFRLGHTGSVWSAATGAVDRFSSVLAAAASISICQWFVGLRQPRNSLWRQR